jgi:hypothetical protein
VSSDPDEIARQRFEIDYIGVLLNSGVAVTSSLTFAGLLNFTEQVAVSKLPLIVALGTVSYVAPKVLVELNRAYLGTKARREGFEFGLREGRRDEESKYQNLMRQCERTVYF